MPMSVRALCRGGRRDASDRGRAHSLFFRRRPVEGVLLCMDVMVVVGGGGLIGG